MARSRRTAAPSTPGIHVTIPVRWGDMDSLGHVNNTLYFRYCESARIAYLEAMGVRFDRRRGATGPGLVAAHVNFRRQVRYPATLIATANVTAIGRSSYTFTHVLRDAANHVIVAEGGAVCVWMHYEKEKALPLPEEFVRQIVRIERNPALSEARRKR